jgi:hypothetical protein
MHYTSQHKIFFIWYNDCLWFIWSPEPICDLSTSLFSDLLRFFRLMFIVSDFLQDSRSPTFLFTRLNGVKYILEEIIFANEFLNPPLQHKY